MVYVLDLLLVEYSVFIKCPSLNPLKIDGRARKHARVQNMAPHISCTNTHVILGLTCLYVIHMSVVCTNVLYVTHMLVYMTELIFCPYAILCYLCVLICYLYVPICSQLCH